MGVRLCIMYYDVGILKGSFKSIFDVPPDLCVLSGRFCYGFPMTRYPKIECVKYGTKRENKTLA